MQFLDVTACYLFSIYICLLFVISVFVIIFLCCLCNWPYGTYDNTLITNN
jgi:uncharacterized membrane protein YgaE (UPF0421/DUF939 family)